MVDFGNMMISGCLTFLGGSLFIFVVLAISITLLIKYRKRTNEVLSVEAKDYFSTEISSLKTWREKAFQDLAAYPAMVWRSGFSDFNARGTFKSLSNLEGAAWVVFEIKYKDKSLSLDMHTSENAYRMEAGNNFYYPSVAIVSMDGNEFGRMEKVDNEISLLELNGYKVGTYYRYDETKHPGLRGLLSGSRYGSVELKGRPRFKICLYIYARPRFSGKFERDAPLFKDLSWRPREEEEKWLMALVGWEILEAAGNTIMVNT